MSEKLYACLLRLFPSQFRKQFGAEALVLFRDRARDERGALPRLRLWLDLLIDLAVSVPRAHINTVPEILSAQPLRHFDGMFLFRLQEEVAPRASALLFGGVLSLATLGAVPALINHFSSSRLPHTPDTEPQRSTLASFGFGKLQASQSNPTDSGRRHSGSSEKLDGAEKRRVLEGVITNLKEHYVYPDLADKIADALLRDEMAGRYEAITDGAGFAEVLTNQVRNVSHDMHLEVVYIPGAIANGSSASSGEGLARYQRALEASNCTFEKIQVLPNNIGYLKLNSFPDPSVCGATARAAMTSLNNVSAIIFDLRANHGGYPGMVMLMAAYLFDHPEYMYNPRENTTEQSWTHSPVSGNKLADKPVYVLTSARTFSGAEHFSYDLKMLKRATLVGETTGGASDVGTFHRIDDHFGIGIRETKPINPYSEPDWAVVGVQPNVKVTAANALKTAEQLAEQKLRRKKLLINR